MEPGESSYSAERRRFPVAFLAGAIVMALLFGGFYLLTRILGSHGPSVAAKLPFGAAEQAYAERIHFNDLHMSRSTNMIKQEFTYVTGTMSNDGVQSIRAMEVTVEFRDGLNQVILRDSQFVIAPQGDPPLNAGLSREFQVTLEHVPAEWNQEYPSIRVTGLVLQ
jgi:hypothetical protein